MSGQWAEVLSAISAGVSSLIAFVAILMAVINGRRSREVAKAQIYLALRDRFLNIYERLGDRKEIVPRDVNERLARQAYWHHSFDEWYVSHKLAPREMGYMWAQFYEPAIRSGYDEDAIRSGLEELLKDPAEGFAAYAKDFVSSLRNAGSKRRGHTWLPGRRRR